MRRVVLPALAFVLALVMAACSGGTSTPEASPATTETSVPSAAPVTPSDPSEPPAPELKVGKMVTYTDEDGDFTVEYPKDWSVIAYVDDPQSCEATVCFRAPAGSDGIPPAITGASANTTSKDLDAYWKLNKTLIQSSWNVPAKLVDSEETTWLDAPAIKSTYTLEPGGLSAKGEQILTVIDGYAYIVSGASLDAVWKDYKKVLKEQVESFTPTP